ncbi:MAG: hypothetical protein HKP55_14800, partial [Gammaproteobacteria bacterium]|nr:hypothetical protein [Gammaproteobacteria bacterium]
MKNNTYLALFFCCLSAWNNVSADTGLFDKAFKNGNSQIHGFITQGYTYTTDNNFFGESSDNGSFEFTELGINISGRLSERVFGSAQVISRTTGAFYDGKPDIDYAMLDFNAISNENWLGGIRVGRTKNPYGLYNDGRDAAVTRNGILLPQSIYFDKVRNLVMHSDGLQLYADISMDNADLYVQSAYGYAEMGVNVEHTYLARNFPGVLEERKPLSVTRFIYEHMGGLLRLGYTKALGDMEYEPGLFDPISAGQIDFDLDIFSLEYNHEHWSITAEYMQQDIDWQNLSVLHDNNDHVADGYYLQFTVRPEDKTEFFIRYDVSHTDRDD